MSTRRGSLALGASLFLLVAGTTASRSLGDDGPAAATPPAAARNGEAARRVPDYFGQIGLTPQQREQIYSIRAKRLASIDELLRKVEEERAEMLKECEGVLTDTQKGLLGDLRNAAKSKGEKAQASARAIEAAAKPGN